MSPWKRADRAIWWLKLPTVRGGRKDLSTGTRDKPTANAMERMIAALGPKGKRAWDLLTPLAQGTLSIGRLYDAYANNQLDRLRGELDDLDLCTKVEPWQRWLVGRVDPTTAARYEVHLESLISPGRPFLRSRLTPEAIETWLSSREVSGPTKRKYFAALASFVGYCRSLRYLTTSPLADLKPPKASNPKVEFLELAEVKRVVDAAPKHARALFAFLYGTGCDLSVALQLTRRDVDLSTKEVRARGTKTGNRDRVVTVAEWAWPYLTKAMQGRLPGGLLFEGLSRWTASDIHREIVKDLKLYRPGIRLHGARHHYAVRAIRAGAPIELVARQLGNDPATCLRYYGRFVPTSAERRHWEKRASAMERGGGK